MVIMAWGSVGSHKTNLTNYKFIYKYTVDCEQIKCYILWVHTKLVRLDVTSALILWANANLYFRSHKKKKKSISPTTLNLFENTLSACRKQLGVKDCVAQ